MVFSLRPKITSSETQKTLNPDHWARPIKFILRLHMQLTVLWIQKMHFMLEKSGTQFLEQLVAIVLIYQRVNYQLVKELTSDIYPELLITGRTLILLIIKLFVPLLRMLDENLITGDDAAHTEEAYVTGENEKRIWFGNT